MTTIVAAGFISRRTAVSQLRVKASYSANRRICPSRRRPRRPGSGRAAKARPLAADCKGDRRTRGRPRRREARSSPRRSRRPEWRREGSSAPRGAPEDLRPGVWPHRRQYAKPETGRGGARSGTRDTHERNHFNATAGSFEPARWLCSLVSKGRVMGPAVPLCRFRTAQSFERIFNTGVFEPFTKS